MSESTGDDTDAPVPERVSRALDDLYRDGRVNALLAWLLVAVLWIALAESVLDRDLEWMAFVTVAAIVVLVPPIGFRNWRAMLPWELLVVALLPIFVRGLFGGEIGTFATYVAVAAFALLIVVELHVFTSLSLTHWFAVGFVVLTTMAAAAVGAMGRYALDTYAGTSYLTTNEALMEEFLWVTLAGIVAGVLFDAYFRRRDLQLRRAIKGVITR